MKLNNKLLPYQKEAVEKLIKLKVGALFMEQGTGKSITALEISRRRYEAGKIDAVIWLCPCSAKENIKIEIIKQCPPELSKLFIICGIETLSTSIRANTFLLRYTKRCRCFIIIDETLLVKNPRAYRTMHISRIARQCLYRMILNGTPISKSEADLYSQFRLLDWRILGYRSFWSFAANHIEYDQFGNIRRALNVDYLAEKIKPYTYQVKKADCVQLPEKFYATKGFLLSEAQEKEYDRVAEKLFLGVDEYRPAMLYRLFSGLQAVISGKKIAFVNEYHFETEEMFGTPTDNPRISLLLDILPKEKTIIFCRYTSEIEQICSILEGAVRFDGTVPMAKRNEVLKKFEKEAMYLVANKNCAGYSLNLQFCHNIINYSHDWELGKRLQSEDRVHRIGQEHPVNIIDICAYNTIDEQILRCLSRKEWIIYKLQQEIEQSENIYESVKKYIYGSRYTHTIFDMKDLEDGYA